MSERKNEWLDVYEQVRRIVQGGGLDDEGCSHFIQMREVTPSADGCEDCLKIGDTWVHLRICLICGHVGCCNDSKNKHASKHFQNTEHALMMSFEPGEDWLYCYRDELLVFPT